MIGMQQDTNLWTLNTQDEVDLVLYSSECNFYSEEEAINFLKSFDNNKSPTGRLVAWSLAFGLFSGNKSTWSNDLCSLASHYFSLIDQNFSAFFMNPLDGAPDDFRDTLKIDLIRTIHWYERIADEIGLDPSSTPDALLRISRIYTTIVFYAPNIGYRQGFDRYGCVFFALTALVCKHGHLSLDLAEAWAFSLTFRCLEVIPLRPLLSSQALLISHFKILDNLIANVDLKKWNILESTGTNSLFFGSRWEILLYADEHSGSEILQIWDHIFAHKSQLKEFIACTSVAHIEQIPIEQTDLSVNSTIMHFSDWNIQELLSCAEEIFNHKRTTGQYFMRIIFPCLPSLHGYQISDFFVE